MFHHVFVKRFEIADAALGVHPAKDGVINPKVKKIHKFIKAVFRDEISWRFEFGFDVFKKHGIMKASGSPKTRVCLAIVIVTFDEIFDVVAFGKIGSDAAGRIFRGTFAAFDNANMRCLIANVNVPRRRKTALIPIQINQ